MCGGAIVLLFPILIFIIVLLLFLVFIHFHAMSVANHGLVGWIIVFVVVMYLIHI